MMRNHFFQWLTVCWLCSGGITASAQEATVESSDQSAVVESANESAAVASSDEVAVKAAIQSYVTAFNAKDMDKLAGLWSPEGVYTNRTTGEETVGREAVTASFRELFENAETTSKLAVATDSIDFVSPNVALERGIATITRATGEIEETDYSVIYVKRDNEWLIDRVTEEEAEPTHYEQLKVLDGLIGDWAAEAEGFRIEISCQWTAKQNFIASQYKIFENEVESSGLQVIGWDAKEQKIRSWLFDSDGGVVTGTWNKRNDGWSVASVATLGGGESGSFTGILRMQDDGNFSWEKINQIVDGQLLPNNDEITLQRQ